MQLLTERFYVRAGHVCDVLKIALSHEIKRRWKREKLACVRRELKQCSKLSVPGAAGWEGQPESSA
jgi:hypothetical protein